MTIKPQVLAETLFTELVLKKHCEVPPEVRMAAATVVAVDAKIRHYQFASVLMALIAMAQSKPEFLSVQEHFERLYFPPTPEQGYDVLLDVRSAMNDVGGLLIVTDDDVTNCDSKAGKSMFWARNWLSSVGIEEHNPVTLALFSWKWMDYYVMVNNLLKEFNPVA